MSESVILAIADLQIIGCLVPSLYEGPEYPHPHGWGELLDREITFDQVDVDLLSEEMAQAFIAHYTPLGWAYVQNVRGHTYWQKLDPEGKTIYNCTDDGEPPAKTAGGYYDLSALKRLKGDLS